MALDGNGGGSAALHKLYYRIGEVATILDEETHVLRYWETEFRSIRPQKSARGQRVYTRRDVERLLQVKELLRQQGFTIAGAKKKLREGGIEPREAVAADGERSDRLRATLVELRSELAGLLDELTPREP